MAHIEIYTKDWCPYCASAKALLRATHLAYDEIDVTTDGEREQEMVRRSERRSVPQIFIDGTHVGGSDDLKGLQVSGELDRMVQTELGGERRQRDAA